MSLCFEVLKCSEREFFPFVKEKSQSYLGPKKALHPLVQTSRDSEIFTSVVFLEVTDPCGKAGKVRKALGNKGFSGDVKNKPRQD